MKKILIIVDMQNDFIDGSLGSKQAKEIVPKVCKKIENFNGEIFATLDTHGEDYLATLEGQKLPVEHCIECTDGHKLNEEISNSLWKNKDYTNRRFSGIIKYTFGYDDWYNTLYLDEDEDEIESIELCGLCTSICVLANAVILRALCPNTKIIVDSSCCACVSEESHRIGLEAMKMQQIDVIGE